MPTAQLDAVILSSPLEHPIAKAKPGVASNDITIRQVFNFMFNPFIKVQFLVADRLSGSQRLLKRCLRPAAVAAPRTDLVQLGSSQGGFPHIDIGLP